jgi:hypothetical protein
MHNIFSNNSMKCESLLLLAAISKDIFNYQKKLVLNIFIFYGICIALQTKKVTMIPGTVRKFELCSQAVIPQLISNT